MADYPDRADEPRHRSRRPHARLRNETVLKWVVPTVIGAIGCFGVLESWIWLRQRQHAKRLRQHQAYLDRRPARVKLHGYNTADRLVKESEFDEVVYELLPGLDVCGKYGEVIQTNTQGFRTNTLVENPIAFEPSAFDYAVGRARNTITIAVIGDSVAFGGGVNNGENYSSRIEAILRDKLHAQGVDTRAINSGVLGYNTRMEVATLRHKLLRFEPDVVLLGFCGNDDRLPKFMKVPTDWKSGVRDLVKVGRRLIKAPDGPREYGAILDTVPPWYGRMHGWESVESALDEMDELTRKCDLPVEVLLDCCYCVDSSDPDVYLGDANRRMAEHARQHSFGVIDPFPKLARHKRANGLRWHDYWVSTSPVDMHPNALKHRLLAEAICEAMLERGYLRRLIERARRG